MSLKHIGNLDDTDVAEALAAFLRSATGEDVSVEFAAGVASLTGRVRSATARRAIEDLVMAHEGVQSIVNNITVAAPETAPRPSSRPA
jgi:osmotically-inducible protein OsmY